MHEVELHKRVGIAIQGEFHQTLDSAGWAIVTATVQHTLNVLGLKPLPDGSLPVFLIVPPGVNTHMMQVATMAASLPIDSKADAMASAAVSRRATGKKVTKFARKK